MNSSKRQSEKKPDSASSSAAASEGTSASTDPTDRANAPCVRVDMDAFSPENQERIYAELVELSGVPLFEGRVEHIYTTAVVKNPEVCPRCHAATRLHNARFIYITDAGQRTMLAPAGYFCTACPTVIVDEVIISRGVKPGFEFQRVVGIDHGKERPANYFKTWNGRKAVYLLDGDQQIIGFEPLGEGGNPYASPLSAHPGQHKDQSKRKRHLAKRARRRNRSR